MGRIQKPQKAIRIERPDNARRIWCFLAVCWPVLCFIFAGIVMCRPGQAGEERIVDTMFTLFPLIFFTIGMAMWNRLLKEQRYATVLTMATVACIRSRPHIGAGNKRNYFPEYEFRAGEKTCRVKYSSGYSRCYVKEGQQVKLYYAPDNPNVFYVPIMQRHDKRWAMLLCGVGIVYPLVGLFASRLRSVFSFLE